MEKGESLSSYRVMVINTHIVLSHAQSFLYDLSQIGLIAPRLVKGKQDQTFCVEEDNNQEALNHTI